MMRFRHVFLLGGSLLILFSLFLSDPNGGAMTFVMFQQLATPVMAVGFAHLARRALFDYMDLEKLMEKAMETSQGAAVAGGLLSGEKRTDLLIRINSLL